MIRGQGGDDTLRGGSGKDDLRGGGGSNGVAAGAAPTPNITADARQMPGVWAFGLALVEREDARGNGDLG